MKRQPKRQEPLLSTQLLYRRRMEIISRLNDEALAALQEDERNSNKKREEQNEKPKHRRFKKKN